MTTNDLLDALKAFFGSQSDYALSKNMGWTRQRVSNYRNREGAMDDETAIQVAAALNLDFGEVLAWMHAERTDIPEVRQAWQTVAARLQHGGAPTDKQNYPVLFREAMLKMLKDQSVTQNLFANIDGAHNNDHRLSPWKQTWTRMIFRLAAHRPKVDAHTLRSLRF